MEFKVKRKCILSLCLIAFVITSATAQKKFNVSGKAKACYAGNYTFNTSNTYVTMYLKTPDEKVKYYSTVNPNGDFIFENVIPGTYLLLSSSLEFNQKDDDSIIVVDKETNNLSFCFDRAYRPAPIDSLNFYKLKAKEDIKLGKAKIYEFTPWSLTSDPFIKLNARVKKKFGVEYEMKSCSREVSRSEILHSIVMDSI